VDTLDTILVILVLSVGFGGVLFFIKMNAEEEAKQ